MFYLLLLAALGCAFLLWRQPRGAGRALTAGAGVLFLAGALIMVFNIWKTITSPETETVTTTRPQLVAAE